VSHRRLRVLHILHALRPSGAEVMLAVAAPLFAEEGVDGEILSTGSERGPFAETLASAGFRIHHIPFAKSPAFFLKLWRLARTGCYDVVHIHTEQATFWVGITLLAARVPVILKSIHSAFAFSGGLRIRRKVQRHILAWLGVRQVSVSRSVQDCERSHFGLETEVVNNWFDAARFWEPSAAERREARRALAVPDDEVVLISVGNCSEFKNHGEFLRALALLPAGGRPLYLHVGEEERGTPERELARTLGVAERVRFLGSQDDVRSALHAADGFVMPSLREGLGISVLEAMATGLPAILTDVYGLRDFRPLFPGVLYAEPTAESLSRAVLAFVDQTVDARRLAARDHSSIVRKEYDARSGVTAYLRIYRGQ
jgi:glycosyltransferase involved in cell wall biosynthesis